MVAWRGSDEMIKTRELGMKSYGLLVNRTIAVNS